MVFKISFDNLDVGLKLLQAIPRVTYDKLRAGLSKENLRNVKQSGVIVVTGAVPKEVNLKSYINLILAC